MSRRVLLPRELDERLDGLTALTEEVNGIILYRRNGDLCPLEGIFMTAVGTVGHVQASPDRMEIANAFFRRFPEYQFVKFHTHSRGTIAAFGPYFARHLSGGDRDAIKEQLRHDREFMAMLVTPETKILSGIDNPELMVVDNFHGYQERHRRIGEYLEAIAAGMGYQIRNLQARM